MRTAIRKHLGDFIALSLLFAVALGAAGYMLAHQRLRFPLIQSAPMELKAIVPGGFPIRIGEGLWFAGGGLGASLKARCGSVELS